MTRQNEGGFTLIEVVFGVAIMAIMVAAIGGLYVSNIATVSVGKERALGLALADEKLEIVKNMPYDSLATKNGSIYPPGNILDDENVTRDNFKFRVHTNINYVDDPYDGYITCPCASGPAAGKPKDLYPYDYKKVEIIVYLSSSGKKIASLDGDVAGKAAETSSNTGILSITVLDANGKPVVNASVHVTNTVPSPDVDITTTTDNNGLVVIPKLPPDANNKYQVTASFSGYSTDGTIPDPAGSQNAVKLNPNVLAQQITPVTLSIDQLSTLALHVVDTSGSPISGLSVTTTGAKQIKTNPVVYKYSQATATDASGNISLPSMEWDAYSFGLPAGKYLVSASPYVPVALNPNATQTVNLVVSSSSSWPTIKSVSPASATTGTASSSLVVTGTNLQSSSTLKLKMSGQSDISGTGCVSSGGNTTLTCSLDLTGAATGAWDIQVTTSGNQALQTGGFSVTP